MRWNALGAPVVALGRLTTDPDGEADSVALAINSSGIAVGYTERDISDKRVEFKAVYWTPAGVAIDLNTLIDPASGWTLTRAQAISDTKWISGIGTFDPDGPGGQAPYDRLFLLQVPEPGGPAVLSLAGVALLRRRRGA